MKEGTNPLSNLLERWFIRGSGWIIPGISGGKRNRALRQKERGVNGAETVVGDEKSNQERIEKHSPIIHPRPGSPATSRPGVSSASISLQTL